MIDGYVDTLTRQVEAVCEAAGVMPVVVHRDEWETWSRVFAPRVQARGWGVVVEQEAGHVFVFCPEVIAACTAWLDPKPGTSDLWSVETLIEIIQAAVTVHPSARLHPSCDVMERVAAAEDTVFDETPDYVGYLLVLFQVQAVALDQTVGLRDDLAGPDWFRSAFGVTEEDFLEGGVG